MWKIYLIAFKTIVRKEIYRFLRIWVQTLIPPAITATLYFLIFGQIIGGKIGNSFGIEYIQFIAPGLIMMSIINNSYSNTVSSFFSSKFQRNIEEIKVAPVPNFVVISGFIIGGMVRGISVGFITFLVTSLFIPIEIKHVLSISITTLTASAIFATAGLINAIYAKTFDDISLIPTFVLAPLTYLGGVFYSIESLPSSWQIVFSFNPILYIISSFRYGFLGIESINNTLSLLIMFAALLMLLYIVSVLFKRDSYTSY